MSEKEVIIGAPYTTYVNIDGRDEDVEIRVDPAMLFTKSVAPGTKITPGDYVPGIAVNVLKEGSLCINLLMTDDQALEYLKAVAACVVRSVPERLDQALEMAKQGMEEALKDPARRPGQVEGGENAPVEGM